MSSEGYDLSSIGFQSTQLGRAVELIERMKDEGATVFLSFTSNMMASGLRGIFIELVRRKFVDVVITAGGSIDHDIIRTYKDYYIGDFNLDDSALHRKGLNRIGNILVPTDRYVFLEKKINPVLKKLHASDKKVISPSELIAEFGKTLNEKSFLYWAQKNKIPVFCPGLTDSAIGLQLYFFKQSHRDFILDVTKDMPALASRVLDADKTGGIVLGGGISKHHTIGVNLLRGGLDYAVYVTTSQPWDGSLSGARTNEAISWGKIKEKANHVTIDGDATLVVPPLLQRFLR